MILKVLLFPFLLIKSCVGMIVVIIRLLISVVSQVCRFGFGRVLGMVFGALVGAAGGSKHLRVKWFPKKK